MNNGELVGVRVAGQNTCLQRRGLLKPLFEPVFERWLKSRSN